MWSIDHHKRIKEKKPKSFGNKPSEKRNPLLLREYYEWVRAIANEKGCDAHHFLPKSHLQQDIFLSIVPVAEHRDIHSTDKYKTPLKWAELKGIENLVLEAMKMFEEWAELVDLPREYFTFIDEVKESPEDYADIAKEFIHNNRALAW